MCVLGGDHKDSNRFEIVEGMFANALKHICRDEHGAPSDFSILRDWWYQLPEQFDENLPDFLLQTPVKDHLVKVLDTASLSRILFGGENRPLSESLEQQYPGIVYDMTRGAVRKKANRFRALAKLWQDICHFDTADELAQTLGENSISYRALKEIHKAFTTEPDGTPAWGHNEIKLNCPTVTGIGIVRNKRPIYLENFSARHSLSELLGTATKPDWLVVDGDKPKDTLVVPESLWKSAMAKLLPLVVLDP